MTSELADKQAIEELHRRFALAVDGKNFVQIEQLFTADGVINFNGSLPVEKFIAIFTETQKTVDTQHFSINSVATLDADSAIASSYFLGYHRVTAKVQDETIGQIYGKYDVDTDLFQGGTYDDELVRSADGWRIKVRNVSILWSQTAPSQPRMKTGWTAPAIFAAFAQGR